MKVIKDYGKYTCYFLEWFLVIKVFWSVYMKISHVEFSADFQLDKNGQSATCKFLDLPSYKYQLWFEFFWMFVGMEVSARGSFV